jgi:hypothetical protein
MKIILFFNAMHKNVQNYDDYVICIFRNVRCIFDSKNNGIYWEC